MCLSYNLLLYVYNVGGDCFSKDLSSLQLYVYIVHIYKFSCPCILYLIAEQLRKWECVRFTFYSFCSLIMAGFISTLFCIHFEGFWGEQILYPNLSFDAFYGSRLFFTVLFISVSTLITAKNMLWIVPIYIFGGGWWGLFYRYLRIIFIINDFLSRM